MELFFKIFALFIALVGPYIVIAYPQRSLIIINHPIFMVFCTLLLIHIIMNNEYVLAITMITAWLSLILTSYYVKMKRYKSLHTKPVTEKFTAIYDDIPIPEESKSKNPPIRCGADFMHEFINRELQLERDIWFRDMLVNDAKKSVDEFCTNNMGLKEVTERYDKIIDTITKNILLK